ncbi:MAG TPA: SpoIVB peptidase S55 domain-containing protein [Humisphaera sp.]|jgi:hypothetical protein|nr:SpoIVB peptidase S55 domain-containing protein [Humisphaera sp.]
MRYLRVPLLLPAIFLLACGLPGAYADSPSPAKSAPTTAPASLFDPARHMRVSEVRAGMSGYGLTVFSGARPEKFDVEVISVLKNFNPQYDVVLIRCKDARLEHSGAIQGMSGSPIYLKDDAGHERMIGAFAYGWPMTKDPIAGVQPIEYMLELPQFPAGAEDAKNEATAKARGAAAEGSSIGWAPLGGAWLPRFARHRAAPDAPGLGASSPLHLVGNADRSPRLQPLSTPLMAAGISPAILDQLSPGFRAGGMVPLQSGAASAPTTGEPAKLEPGAVLAVPLLTGDLELTAIGTCTEVLGDRVFGFGHPFNNEGRVSLPMGSGSVNGIIPNLQMSFKLGALDQIRGTLTTDAAVGVAGMTGAPPPMIPIELSVTSPDGSAPRVYRFRAARHPKLSPMIAAAAFAGALAGRSELPQLNTIDYDLTLTFTNGKSIRLANRTVNGTPPDIFGDAGAVIAAAADNPYERVMLLQISGNAKISATAQAAQVLDVHLPKSKYRPGETLKAYVTYQPFRAEPGTIPVQFDLPRDLKPGGYQLVISDAERYFADEQEQEPFHLTAQSIEDVFALLKDVTSIRENALYLRLIRQPDGVAVGRTALPQLPSSRRQMLLGAGRSDVTAYVSSTVEVIPTNLVMNGAAEFAITVEAGAKVAVGGVNPPSRATPTPPAKSPEPAKPPGIKEPAPKDVPKDAPPTIP